MSRYASAQSQNSRLTPPAKYFGGLAENWGSAPNPTRIGCQEVVWGGFSIIPICENVPKIDLAFEMRQGLEHAFLGLCMYEKREKDFISPIICQTPTPKPHIGQKQ